MRVLNELGVAQSAKQPLHVLPDLCRGLPSVVGQAPERDLIDGPPEPINLLEEVMNSWPFAGQAFCCCENLPFASAVALQPSMASWGSMIKAKLPGQPCWCQLVLCSRASMTCITKDQIRSEISASGTHLSSSPDGVDNGYGFESLVVPGPIQ